MSNVTVIVPKSYSFTIDVKDPEYIKDTEDGYKITITPTVDGDFQVTGVESDVLSFVDDICIGDRKSIQDIMSTGVISVADPVADDEDD